MSRVKRLSELLKVPPMAAVDHRFFLNEKGEDVRIAALPGRMRRAIKSEARKIGRKYKRLIVEIDKSGAGYPVDRLLRSLAVEYTHRYASSGLLTQPVSFNYFEAFCAIKLIDGSFAPYAAPEPELDHLFNVGDFFDFLTNSDTPTFNLSDLRMLPEGRTYHFTQNGSINDFTYLTAEGREFVISGFSMVRRGNSIHWYLLGGELLSDAESQRQTEDEEEDFHPSDLPADKRPFLTESMKETGNRIGAPVALEGTTRAIRTVIAGETDLTTSKHVGRCYMAERQNSFMLFCDDPDILSPVHEKEKREAIIATMKERVESAAVMWNLAEGFFRLPSYFRYRITVSDDDIKVSGKAPPRTAKGGRGVGANFRHVTSIEISDIKPSIVRAYTSPHFDVDTEGYWRRLAPDEFGQDREGNMVKGRTWIKAKNEWRARPNGPRTVYIKSSVAAAKIQVADYVEAAKHAETATAQSSAQVGVLYVLRCLAMKDEVYKVGWTSVTAEERARELSSATGVPTSFAVVDSWQHPDPAALEKGVHAMLSPYRINEGREFFRVAYPELKAIVEAEIVRSEHHMA